MSQQQVKIQQFGCSGDNNQQWRFEGDGTGSGHYVIYSVESGLCLDIPDGSTNSGVVVQQFPFHADNNTNQKWRVQW